MANSILILNGISGIRLTSPASGFGGNVASAGDFNCDGRSGDVIVCGNDATCYLFFSGYFNDLAEADTSILNGTNGFKLVGPTNAGFAGALSVVVNITGNGCSGLMISAYGVSIVYTLFPMRYPPAVYNISNVNASTGLIFVGIPNTALGAALAGDGDVDGDGKTDIALTTSTSTPTPSYVILGRSNFIALAEFVRVNVSAPPAGAYIINIIGPLGLGTAICISADINKDGFDDIAISMNGNVNAVGIAFGGTNLPSMINVSTSNGANISLLTSSSSYFGITIVSAGNVNSNGYQGLLIGTAAEVAFLLFGQPFFPANFDTSSFNGTNGVNLTSSIGGEFGGAVTRAGYTDSNGLNGFLVGTFSTNSTFFFNGRETWPATVDTSSLNCATGIELIASISQAGCVLANIGDFNGDGIPDFVMGSCGTQNAAAIVFGQSFVTCTATNTPSESDSRTRTVTGTPTSTRINPGTTSSSLSDTASKFASITESPTDTRTVTQFGTATSTGRATLTSSSTKSGSRILSATQSSSQAVSQSGTESASSPTHTASKSRTSTITPFVTLSLSHTEAVAASSSYTDTASNSEAETSTATETSSTRHVRSKSFTATKSATEVDTASHTASRTPTSTPSLTPTLPKSVSVISSYTNTESTSKAETSTTAPSSATPVTSRSFTATTFPSYTESHTPLLTKSRTPTASVTPTSPRTASFSYSLSSTNTESNSKAETLTYTRTVTSSATEVASKSFTATKFHSYTESKTPLHTSSQRATASATPTSHRTSRSLSGTLSASSTEKRTATQSSSRWGTKSFTATKSATEVATEPHTSTHSATSTPSIKTTSHRTSSKSHSSSYTVTASNSKTHTPTATGSTTHTASKFITASVSRTDRAFHTTSHTLTTSVTPTPSITTSPTETRLDTTKTPTSSTVSRTLSLTSSKSEERSPSATSSHTSASSSSVSISSTSKASQTFSLHSSKSVTPSVTESQTHTTSHTRTPSPTAFDTSSVTKPSSLSGTISSPATRTTSLSPLAFETSSPYTFPPVLNLLVPNKKVVQFSVANDAYSTGFFIASLGDINNDGIGDFVLTTTKTNFSAPGTVPICVCEAYVTYGQKNISNFQTNLALLKAPLGFSIGNIPGAVKNATKAPPKYARYTQTQCLSFGAGLGYINTDNVSDFGIINVLANWNSVAGPGSVSVVFGNATTTEDPLDLANLNGDKGFTVIASPRPIHVLDNRKMVGGISGAFGGSIGFGYITAGDSNMFLIGDTWATLNLPNVTTGSPKVWAGELNIIPRAASFASMIDSQALPLGSVKIPIRTETFSVCDINGDQIGDIVLGNMQVLGKVVYGRSRFNSSIYNPAFDGQDGFVIVGAPSSRGIAIVTGDLDGNGLCDIVIAVPQVNNGSVYTILNTGAFASAFNVSTAYGQNVFRLDGKPKTLLGGSIALKDINGDGMQDLMVMGQDSACGNSTLHVFLGRANFSVYNSILGTPDGREYFMITNIPGCSPTVASADVTGNGMADILISTGQWSDAAEAYLIEW